MANNFSSTNARIANNSLTTVVSTTSNKQIVIGCLVANTGGTAILVDVMINDGSNDRFLIKEAPLPTGSSLEVVSGKVVIPSGGSLKIKSNNGSGNVDAFVSLLTDVA